MKSWIIILIYFLPAVAISQENDSILPPPDVELPSLEKEKVVQKIDLAWADTVINKIQKICLVQLRPLCDDGKKRKTIPSKPKRGTKGCYTETVIKHDLKFIPELDSIFMTEVVVGFDKYRMYKWQEIDTADYKTTIESALGKRESSIITMCYEPRHALVFLDSMENILGIYEICFECGNSKIAFNYVESVSIYPTDYRVLKNLFIKYGYIEPKKITKKRNTGNTH